MIRPNLRPSRRFGGLTLVALVTLMVGAIAGLTCAHNTDKSASVPLKVHSSCDEYCDRRAECDDDVNAAKCRERCVDVMANCQADEQNRALNDLTGCTRQTCDVVDTCAIGAGSTCIFGI